MAEGAERDGVTPEQRHADERAHLGEALLVWQATVSKRVFESEGAPRQEQRGARRRGDR